MLDDSFAEVAALLALAAAMDALALRLHQPLVVAFICVGILVGPAALGWVMAHDEVDLLGYGAVARVFLGTVAGDVLRDVPCDVLVVPPRGDASPG